MPSAFAGFCDENWKKVYSPKVVRPGSCSSLDAGLKQFVQEPRRSVRDANDFVGRLTVQFEIELRLRLAVVPVGERFQLASSEAPLRDRGASDGDAHPRRLPGDPGLLCDRFGRGDDALRDETRPALILAREHKDRVARGDVLAAIHCLLRGKRECFSGGVGNLGFDRKRYARRFVRAQRLSPRLLSLLFLLKILDLPELTRRSR